MPADHTQSMAFSVEDCSQTTHPAQGSMHAACRQQAHLAGDHVALQRDAVEGAASTVDLRRDFNAAQHTVAQGARSSRSPCLLA